MQPLYKEVPPWVGESLWKRMLDPEVIVSVAIQSIDPLKGHSSTSQNEIELSIALACCYMTAEDTMRMCQKDKDLHDLEEDSRNLLNEVLKVKTKIGSGIKLKDSNIKDIQKKTAMLGAKWNNNGISMAAMHIFCSGIIETQINRIERSEKHKVRVSELTYLKEKFDGMWHLIDAWFPHDSAESDSIELFNDFNMCMG